MAIIFEEQLKISLKRDGLLPVYILFGEDAYLKGMYLNKISKSIADEDDIFNSKNNEDYYFIVVLFDKNCYKLLLSYK